jgi:zinc protease
MRALAGVFVVIATLAARPGRAQPVSMTIPFERYQLANGMDVILHQDRRIPVVYVNVTYHVGSGNERPGQSGYAHLFEHLMFQGSKHTGMDQHFAILQGIGARGANGTTNADRTNYYQSVPAAELETALWLESDRMGYLMLDQQALDNQREVVRNERRQSYENVAYSQEIFAVARALYPEGHPYRNLTIGLHEDLQRATLDDARAFFARWYVPANATLLLAGDFDSANVRALIEKWFGTFPASRKPKVTVPPAPVLTAKHREQFTDALATVTRVRYVWPSPAFFAPGDAELDLIAALLASTTGRLRKRVTYDKALARAVRAGQLSRAFSGEFSISVDLQPNVSLAEVEAAITASISEIVRSGVGERELRQAVVAREVGSLRSLETLAARGAELQMYTHFGRAPDSVAWDLDRYRMVRPADIKATAARVLTANRVEIITLPMPGTSSQALRAGPGRSQPGEMPPLQAGRPLEAELGTRAPMPVPPAAPRRRGN